jgi:hypothetical protein
MLANVNIVEAGRLEGLKTIYHESIKRLESYKAGGRGS